MSNPIKQLKQITANVYLLWSPKFHKFYVGSTTFTIKTRLSYHKSDYKRYLKRTYRYVNSFKIIKQSDTQVKLIENFTCNSKEEMHRREQHYIDKLRDRLVNLQNAFKK